MPHDILGPPGHPIIRLTLEGMRLGLLTMLNDEHLRVSAEIKQAVENYCRPENLQRVIQAEIDQQLTAAIKSEVQSFFGYGGPGRIVIREAIHLKLTKEIEECEKD